MPAIPVDNDKTMHENLWTRAIPNFTCLTVVKKTCPTSMRFIGPQVINQQRSITQFAVNVLQFFMNFFE